MREVYSQINSYPVDDPRLNRLTSTLSRSLSSLGEARQKLDQWNQPLPTKQNYYFSRESPPPPYVASPHGQQSQSPNIYGILSPLSQIPRTNNGGNEKEDEERSYDDGGFSFTSSSSAVDGGASSHVATNLPEPRRRRGSREETQIITSEKNDPSFYLSPTFEEAERTQSSNETGNYNFGQQGRWEG